MQNTCVVEREPPGAATIRVEPEPNLFVDLSREPEPRYKGSKWHILVYRTALQHSKKSIENFVKLPL